VQAFFPPFRAMPLSPSNKYLHLHGMFRCCLLTLPPKRLLFLFLPITSQFDKSAAVSLVTVLNGSYAHQRAVASRAKGKRRMKSKRTRIATRIAISFGVLTAMILLVAIVSIKALNESNDRFVSFVHGINARAALADRIRADVDRRAIAARNLVLVTTPADIELEKAAVTQAHTDVQRDLEAFNEMVARAHDVTDEVRARVAEINRVEALYGPVALNIVALASQGEQQEAVRRIDIDCRPLLAALVKATQDYAVLTRTREDYLVAESARHYAVSRAWLLAVCAAAMVGAVAAGILITRGIMRSLGSEPDDLNEVAHRIASGDLSGVVQTEGVPPASVLASMAAMQTKLVELISHVRESAQSIATGSSQIAVGNVDLSARTEEQAASLEETASSVEELTATVRQNAEHAQHANALSANASSIAREGNEAVAKMVANMSEISARSAKIADITSIIESIAFQTNILALNAAVEAARAGEEGRGFAVVASEVRSLAQRSSHAAKEIKELIESSVERVTLGTLLAGQAGTTMTDVLRAVSKVQDIMGEISVASTEQSEGIEQLSLAIAQMDRVTQQNAALVEESAAASQSLDDQGRKLTDAVASFQLADVRLSNQGAR
jgi:methyl-accepting chemotaxis protein